MVLLSAFFILFYYTMLWWLLSERVALIATLLLALNPFHISLSRVLHHDALTTTFMVLSLLAMIEYWLRGWKLRWLIISGVFGGLAILSKPVGWFMIPYAVIPGILGVFYRWFHSKLTNWAIIRSLMFEIILWGTIVVITFIAFFPAMWVIPEAVMRNVFGIGTQMAEDGHLHYFLGQTSLDPGLLFYPVGWLLRASPLEVAGLLILSVAAWRFFRSHSFDSLHQQIIRQPILVAFAVFLALFLFFETLPAKKMVRYFLPAFPLIDVFATIGLLWFLDNLANLSHKWSVGRWKMPLLVSSILVVQGWFIFNHYPYYFTFYNPLLGSISSASHLMTIYGWGEGMDKTGAYLNQQPDAASLKVVAQYQRKLRSFFDSDTLRFPELAGEFMEADYIVYYYNQLQRDLHGNPEVWRYFEKHQTPVHRVTLHELDYALIYRNPISHNVDWRKNGLPNMLYIFGYNLTSDSNLIPYWQNLRSRDDKELWVGLSVVHEQEIDWLGACIPKPGFSVEYNTPEAIVESLCSLPSEGVPADVYNLHFGLNDGASIVPVEFPGGEQALSTDTKGQLIIASQASGLDLIAERELSDKAVSLDIKFENMVRLVGYQLEPPNWQSGHTEELLLYWQPLQKPDLNLASGVELVLRLSIDNTSETILVVQEPVFSGITDAQELKLGDVIAVDYPISVPAMLASGDYLLDISLRLAANGQPVMGRVTDISESIEYLTIPVKINNLLSSN